ncbi:MAG: hypothetical protein K2Q01_12510 [Rickettsiales bacterium]|nr:hypothetical protein [Rickettsiales bacterium]
MKKIIATTSLLLLASACTTAGPHGSTYMKTGEMMNNCQDLEDGSAKKKSCQKMMKDCHDMIDRTGTMPGKDNITYHMWMQCDEMMKAGMK